MHPELRRRHPHHAEERAQRDPSADLVAAGSCVAVERPDERPRIAVGNPEPLVEGREPPARIGDSPGPYAQLVDVHRQRRAGVGTTHLDRAQQRVARVEIRIPRPEPLTRAGVVRRRPDAPARVR